MAGKRTKTLDYDPEQKVIGAKIEQRLRDLGWSQAVWARLMRVSPSTANNWITGRRRMRLPLLQRAAQVLRVDPSYLVGEKTGLSEIEDRAVRAIRGAPPHLQEVGVSALEEVFRAMDRAETTHGRKAE
jgi:transcriptional regulator with XRE-family HTH domain